jgi:hypothetical protein
VYSGPLVPEGEKVQVERYVPCRSSHGATMLILLSARTELSSAVVVAAVEAGVVHRRRSTNTLSRRPYPSRKRRGSRCAAPGRAEAPPVGASTNLARPQTTSRQLPPHLMDAVVLLLQAVAVRQVHAAARRRRWSNWHQDQTLCLLPQALMRQLGPRSG